MYVTHTFTGWSYSGAEWITYVDGTGIVSNKITEYGYVVGNNTVQRQVRMTSVIEVTKDVPVNLQRKNYTGGSGGLYRQIWFAYMI